MVADVEFGTLIHFLITITLDSFPTLLIPPIPQAKPDRPLFPLGEFGCLESQTKLNQIAPEVSFAIDSG